MLTVKDAITVTIGMILTIAAVTFLIRAQESRNHIEANNRTVLTEVVLVTYNDEVCIQLDPNRTYYDHCWKARNKWEVPR